MPQTFKFLKFLYTCLVECLSLSLHLTYFGLRKNKKKTVPKAQKQKKKLIAFEI